MIASFSRFLLAFTVAASFASCRIAFAQTEWIETGSVVATIDGVERTTYSYDVKNGGGDGVTVTPGATYMYNEPLTMGDMVLTAASYLVSVLTYDMALPNTMVGSIELSFYLDPDTLELIDLEEMRVTYLPAGVDPDLTYVLTLGGLSLDPVLVIDESTWQIAGSITGQVSRQVGYDLEHNADDAFDIDARFEFRRVVDYATLSGGQ